MVSSFVVRCGLDNKRLVAHWTPGHSMLVSSKELLGERLTRQERKAARYEWNSVINQHGISMLVKGARRRRGLHRTMIERPIRYGARVERRLSNDIATP
jgi:hypothetical protein